jgi:hypothetical protein
MPSTQPNNNCRALFELLLIAVILGLLFFLFRKDRQTDRDISALRAKYNDSVTFYTDKLGIEIARKEAVTMSYNDLKEVDSAKYEELSARYKQLKSLVGSSQIDIRHDTVKLWFASEDFDMPEIGLVEYQDSCLYAGFDFTDSGTYVNYLLASQSITSTILKDKGKIINDVSISSECGKIAQVKTFVFAEPPKKWHQKPLVVGGIGLGVGIIAGIIIAK